MSSCTIIQCMRYIQLYEYLYLGIITFIRFNCIYINMKLLSFEDFMKKYKIKKTMNESEVQRVYHYRIYPRDFKIFSDKGFVNIDNGSQGGSHWICFMIKNNKPYYFDCFGGTPSKFLLNRLPKTITYHNYKIQDIYSRLCDSQCMFFFVLIEGMNYYDTILKWYFVIE